MKAISAREFHPIDLDNARTSLATETEHDEDEPVLPLWQCVGVRSLLVIAALFWLYVTLSNLMYARSMQINMAQFTQATVFSPSALRVIQHLLLFPPLLVCYWASLRSGWNPYPRIVIQLALAVAFSSLGYFAMNGAEFLWEMTFEMPWPTSGSAAPWSHEQQSHEQGALFLAFFTNFLLTYGFGLGLVTGFALYRRSHEYELRVCSLRRQWSAARLSALRMQLSPHTLFNLLHTIRGQINWHPEIAREMVVQLADLLRRLLSAGQRDFSLLTDEIHFVGLYLELQRQRFSDRLTVVLPEPEELPVAWLPSLILQPLVENAVIHGLAGHDGAVEVRVEAVLSADDLTVRVSNTVAKDREQGHERIGISNVRERLHVQFGSRARLTVGAVEGTRWVAQLRLPALRELTPRRREPQPAPT